MRSMLFVTLPVADLDRARRFYAALGLVADARPAGPEGCLCLPVDTSTMVILQPRARFAVMAAAPSPDPESSSVRREAAGPREVLLTLSVAGRDEVDTRIDAALCVGGVALHATQQHASFYCRSIIDPDGHAWEIVWMDPAAAARPTWAGSRATRTGRSPRSVSR